MEDKKTIGLTAENRAVMERLMSKEVFRHDKDMALFAMSYAIRQDSALGSFEGTGTIWNVGSLDPTGDIRVLLGNLFPDTVTPYRLLESLINTGMSEIGSRLREDPGMDVTDLLSNQP
jgi:hypothetical protein